MTQLKKRRRSVGRRVAMAVLVVVLAYGGARFGFEVWRDSGLPADAPRVLMSLDDTLLNDLGIVRATYEQALARAGARLVAVTPDAAGNPTQVERVRALLDGVDAVLLTGGGDVDPRYYGGQRHQGQVVNRHRDEFEGALIVQAQERGMPILGICRGCQILNVANGGTLREPDDRHFLLAGDHPVVLEPDSLLARIHGTTRLPAVESYHRQAILTPAPSVRVTARAPDGEVEGIELEEGWGVGVQWHPELELLDDQQNALFRALVSAARDHARARGGR